jgi:predicted DNA-binding protein with PD1-like motif
MIKSGFKDQMVQKNNTYLDIVLEDNEDVLECIEDSFKEHDIKKAVLISATGFIKESKIAISRSGNIRQAEYSQPCMIRSVSGEFYLGENDYYGDVHISIAKDAIHQVTGILIAGKAHGALNIKFKIIKDIGHNKDSFKPKPVTMLKQKILDETAPKERKPIIEI